MFKLTSRSYYLLMNLFTKYKLLITVCCLFAVWCQFLNFELTVGWKFFSLW